MIIGKKIIRLKVVDSTNAEARRLIKQGAGEGLVVVAESQVSGRGKPGSRWFSPPGNLFFSAVIKPYKDPRALAPITLLGALAARLMIIKLTGLPVVIKWPNDLLVHGRKVGGVLAERLPSGEVIIGIGINLNLPAGQLPARLNRSATSTLIETKRTIDVSLCLKRLVRELDNEYLAYLAKV